jgi:hypothetical protein
LLGTDKFFEVLLSIFEDIEKRPVVVHGMIDVADLEIIGRVGAMDKF